MARQKGVTTITVPVSDADLEQFEALRVEAMEGISKAHFARMLLHYGIIHADDAMSTRIREVRDRRNREDPLREG